MKQRVHSHICLFCVAEAPEEFIGGDLVCLETHLEEVAEDGKP
jgi:hypothetical protein